MSGTAALGIDVPDYEHLSRADILHLLKVAHRRFYLRPRVLARTALGLASRQEFARLARGAMSLVKLELLHERSRTAPV